MCAYQQSDYHWGNKLHLSFIEQLEFVGLWQWAVYVSLNMDDSYCPIRELTAKSIIQRNCPPVNQYQSAAWQHFVDHLLHIGIPREWIEESYAIRCIYDRTSPHQAAIHMEEAQMWDDYHILVSKHVAPLASLTVACFIYIYKKKLSHFLLVYFAFCKLFIFEKCSLGVQFFFPSFFL